MRFLVAWDGSDGAQAALRQALALAGSDGQIDLVQILNPLIDAADVRAPSTREAMVIVSERARAAMGRQAPPGASQSVILLDRGQDVPDRLLQEAERLGAAIIVIASRRAVGLRGMLGSVTQQILQDSTLPVLVVRA